MTTSVAVLGIIVVIALVIIAVVVARWRKQSDKVPIVDSDDRASWPDDDDEARVVERDQPIRWADSLGVQPGTLNDESRLRLINDLGLIHAAWVVPILAQAYVEERATLHRQAALRAVAFCRHPDALTLLESAAKSSDQEERALAMAALQARIISKSA